MRTPVLTFLFLVVAATSLFGAGGGGHLPPGTLFIASLVNFVLFLFVLVRFGKTPVSSFFAARESEIRSAFEAYRAEYEHTEAEIVRLRKAIADLPAEKERTLADYRRRAEEIYIARMNDARAQAAYIRETSEAFLSSAARERYLAVISMFADRLIHDLAERARSLDAAHHAALVRDCNDLWNKENK